MVRRTAVQALVDELAAEAVDGLLPQGQLDKPGQRAQGRLGLAQHVGVSHEQGLAPFCVRQGLRGQRQPQGRPFGQFAAHLVKRRCRLDAALLGQGHFHRRAQHVHGKNFVVAVAQVGEHRQPEIQQLAHARVLQRDNRTVAENIRVQLTGPRAPVGEIRRGNRGGAVEQGVVPHAAEVFEQGVVEVHDIGMLEKALAVFLVGVLGRQAQLRAEALQRGGAQGRARAVRPQDENELAGTRQGSYSFFRKVAATSDRLPHPDCA